MRTARKKRCAIPLTRSKELFQPDARSDLPHLGPGLRPGRCGWVGSPEGSGGDRVQWTMQGAAAGAALRFSQGHLCPRQKPAKRERYKRGVETPLVLSQFSRRRIKPACENWSTAPDTSRLFRPQDAPACICPPWPSGPSGAESSKSLEASKTSPLSLYSNFCTKTAGPTAQNKKRPTFPCGKVGRFYVTLSAACGQTLPAGQSGTNYLYSSTRRVRCS